MSKKDKTAGRQYKDHLGPLDMGKYLSHYHVPYDVFGSCTKPAMVYQLKHCLFDPDHEQRQAAIVVPIAGAILYQCNHPSCKDRRWPEARRIISGDKSLAEFCQGYDPDWQPAKGSEGMNMRYKTTTGYRNAMIANKNLTTTDQCLSVLDRAIGIIESGPLPEPYSQDHGDWCPYCAIALAKTHLDRESGTGIDDKTMMNQLLFGFEEIPSDAPLTLARNILGENLKPPFTRPTTLFTLRMARHKHISGGD